MNPNSRSALISQHRAERIGLYVLVAATKRAIFLSGRVPSEESYWLAERIAARDAPDKQIENNLVVKYSLPLGSERRRGFILDDMSVELPESLPGFEKKGIELEPLPPEDQGVSPLEAGMQVKWDALLNQALISCRSERAGLIVVLVSARGCPLVGSS